MNDKQLGYTAQALAEVLTFRQPADAVLSSFFRKERKLGRQDRHEIAETVFAVLRRYETIVFFLPDAPFRPRRAALAGMMLGRNMSIGLLEALCSEEDKAFLIAVRSGREESKSRLNTAAELPEWLTDRMTENGFDRDRILAFGRSVSVPATLDVRVNFLKGRRDKVLTRLQEEGLVCSATPYSPWGIRFSDKPALNKHPLFLDGTLEVQDEGSQLVALLTGAARGQVIVDFCAGAGGKTLAVGAMMANSGRIYALDTSEKRLANLKPRMVRAGLTNIHPQRTDSEHDKRLERLKGKADSVLVDVPCSGLGTLRRNPDLKYRQNGDRVAALTLQQHSIFQAAAQTVRPGGCLVYATCSILPEENEQQVEAFLAENTGWAVSDTVGTLAARGVLPDTGPYLQLDTGKHGTDGFFAAVLARTV